MTPMLAGTHDHSAYCPDLRNLDQAMDSDRAGVVAIIPRP
jgi:hypothetical protein